MNDKGLRESKFSERARESGDLSSSPKWAASWLHDTEQDFQSLQAFAPSLLKWKR